MSKQERSGGRDYVYFKGVYDNGGSIEQTRIRGNWAGFLEVLRERDTWTGGTLVAVERTRGGITEKIILRKG